MENPELTALTIEVAIENAPKDEIDRMTRQLLTELRRSDVNSAQLARETSAPAGAKGDTVTVGSIVIELLPAVLPGVITLVQAWVARGKGRVVKFRGKGIEFEGSAEELRSVLEKLDKGKTRR